MENKQEFLNKQLIRIIKDNFLTKDGLQKLLFFIDKGADVSAVKKIRSFECRLMSFIDSVNVKGLGEGKIEQLDNILVQFTESIDSNNDNSINLLEKLAYSKLFKTLKSLLVKNEKEITYDDYYQLVRTTVFRQPGNTETLDCLSESYTFHELYLKKILETGSYCFNRNISDNLLKYLIDKNFIQNKKIAKKVFDNCFNTLSSESIQTLYGILNDESVKMNEDVKEAVKEVVNEIEKETNEDYELIEHVKKYGSLPPGVKIVSNE